MSTAAVAVGTAIAMAMAKRPSIVKKRLLKDFMVVVVDTVTEEEEEEWIAAGDEVL